MTFDSSNPIDHPIAFFYRRVDQNGDGKISMPEIDDAISRTNPLRKRVSIPTEAFADIYLQGDISQEYRWFLEQSKAYIKKHGSLVYFTGCALMPRTVRPTSGVCENLAKIPPYLISDKEPQIFHLGTLADDEQYHPLKQYLQISGGDYSGQVKNLNSGTRYVEISFPDERGQNRPRMAFAADDLQVVLDYGALGQEIKGDPKRYKTLFRTKGITSDQQGGYTIRGRSISLFEVLAFVQIEKFIKELEESGLPETTSGKLLAFKNLLEDKGVIPLSQDWSGNLSGSVYLDLFDVTNGKIKKIVIKVPELVESKSGGRAMTFDVYSEGIQAFTIANKPDGYGDRNSSVPKNIKDALADRNKR